MRLSLLWHMPSDYQTDYLSKTTKDEDALEKQKRSSPCCGKTSGKVLLHVLTSFNLACNLNVNQGVKR